MNKIITVFATMLLTTAVVAAPGGRGGNRGGGHRPAPPRQVQRSASRPSAGRPAAHAAPTTRRHETARWRPGGHGVGRRHRPYAYRHRHWARPPMPPVRPLALYGWTWIATPWTIIVDGVCCTGDGYWFDGYNYYYNDCYYTCAPTSVNLSIAF